MFNWVTDCLASEQVKTCTVMVGVVVAVISVLTARAIARKKQSADLLFATRNDDMLQNGARCLKRYVDSNDKNIASLADAANFASDEAVSVRYFLNHFENVSVGIQAGIYDEPMLKKTWYNIVVKSWEHARPLVNKLREKGAATVLQEYEWLHDRWKKAPLSKR